MNSFLVVANSRPNYPVAIFAPAYMWRFYAEMAMMWNLWDRHLLCRSLGKSGANHPSIYFLSSHQEVMRVKSKSSESVEISGGCGNADSDGGELTRCNGSTAVVANSTTHEFSHAHSMTPWVFSRSVLKTPCKLGLAETHSTTQCSCCPLNTT